MPSLIQKRFTNLETFRKIRPDLLWAWLKQSEDYFKKRGLVIPSAECKVQSAECRIG
jgi:hypothetical protein